MNEVLAPIGAEPLLRLLVGLAVLLAIARLLGRAAERVGLPAIVGELMTGVLLGPSLLGWLAPGAADWLLPTEAAEMHLIDAVAQLGLLLLVGLVGSQLDLAMLRRHGGVAATVSAAGLLVPLVSGIGLGVLLAPVLATGGASAVEVFPLFLGVAMCVTAIPVIVKTLADMGLLHRNIGQLIIAAGMVDDTVGWLLLSVVSAAATTGVVAGQVALSVALMVGFIGIAATLGRPVVCIVMRRSARPGSAVASAVVIVLSGAALTHALRMEPIFGAFVAGLLVAASGPEVRQQLAPLRTVVMAVLAPIFLATAGLRMDLTALARPDVLVAALAVLAVAITGKFAGAYLGARLGRLSRWEGLALGAGMNARGVVEVIVAMTGLRLGLINSAGYTVIVLVAIVTSVMSPPLLRLAMNRVEQSEDERLRKDDHDLWTASQSQHGRTVLRGEDGTAAPPP